MPQLQDVVTSPARRSELVAGGRWTEATLVSQVEEHARRSPDRLAIVDLLGARRRSYAELTRDVRSVAADLRDRGVAAGDVVAVQLPNWYETVVVDLAVLSLGGVVNPMLPIYRAKEVSYMLHTAATRVIFTPEIYRSFDHRDLIRAVRTSVPSLEHHITISTPTPDEPGITGLSSSLEPIAQDASAVSELMFTSGTEAAPKAIMHTEHTTNFGVRVVWQALGMDERDVVWMPSPIGHSTGLNYGLRMALFHGVTLVLQDQWSADKAVDLVAAERCTYTVASTTFLNDFVSALEERPRDVSSLRLFSSGGAPVPASLVDRAKECGFPVLRLYGSTEVLIATWHRPSAPLDKRRSTDGPAMTDVEIEVRDGDRSVIGAPGDLYVRSPSTCVGYFNDPDRTSTTFDPTGWVATGDIGVIDDEGYLTIVGRRKELIIRGGLNVAPREVEELILEHPKVNSAAVVGVPDDRLGEIGCACVVLTNADETLTLDELTGFLRERGLSAFKLPERLELLSELPMTPTGKVQKHELLKTVIEGA